MTWFYMDNESDSEPTNKLRKFLDNQGDGGTPSSGTPVHMTAFLDYVFEGIPAAKRTALRKDAYNKLPLLMGERWGEKKRESWMNMEHKRSRC